MPSINAGRFVEELVGATISTPTHDRPNVVLGVKGSHAIIGTERSPEGEPVHLSRIQEALDRLELNGAVRISPESFGGYRRSSAIGAILAALPHTEVTGPPTSVRLSDSSPLKAHLEEACQLVKESRSDSNVVASDPLYELMVRRLPTVIRRHIPDAGAYKVQGSAGQTNFLWAETPWLGVFDRLVTDSAQRGHYLVYLVQAEGNGIFLSLNQGVTEVRQAGGGNLRRALLARAARLRSFLGEKQLEGLLTAPLNLNGRGLRTRGYEAANVAAVFYQASEVPHDAVLVTDLLHLLRAYEEVTAGLDEDEALDDVNAPAHARSGAESKRYRWHRRAEGRNSAVARRAKQLQGSSCRACGRDLEEELGQLGRACLEAHHLTPFAELDARPRELDPLEDFAVVCANCHRMLHTKTPPLSPAELRQKLER